MFRTYKPTITGEELTRYGRGLDTLCTADPDELIARVELEGEIIDKLLRDERQAINTLIQAVRV